jgi:enoyl-CoA hydratase/carnithine racemase
MGPAMSSAERVSIEISGGVADVRLVRGEKHNALDWAMFTALNETLDQLHTAADVRAVVLSGDGPSFCSGLDFPSFMGGEVGGDEGFARRDGGPANFAQRSAFGWRELTIPVIAAVHGACFGGGLQIALGADLRIAAPDTRMSVMEVKYGLVPDMGLTQTLPGLVRADVARELTFTARIVEAPEAAEIGLVTRISEDPRSEARELAERIASRSPDATRAAKRLLNEGWRAPADEGLALEEELQRTLLGSPNQIAAVVASMSGEPASFADSVPKPARTS